MKKNSKKPALVNCLKHGLVGTVEYAQFNITFLIVCFQCWAEKQCKGLKNFAPAFEEELILIPSSTEPRPYIAEDK